MARDERGRSTVVGFISPFSQPFCRGCSRLRLTATGDLLGCVARSEGVPLAGLLRRHHGSDGAAIAAAVEQALTMKRRDGVFVQPRVMAGIGG